MTFSPGAIALLTGALAGAAATLGARSFAWRFGIVNQPNPIVPQHTRPIAYLGGLAIFCGAAVALAVAHLAASVGRATLVGAALYVALGTLDDVRPLAPLPKLCLQIAIAALAVALGLTRAITGVAALDGVLSALWIVAVVNAFNLTDVCDGLVGGIGAVSLLGASLLFAGGGAALAVAGASVGFLLWNRPPASIFLGDGGSHLLGFALAATTLLDARASLPACALLAGVPLFELCFLVVVRARKGIPWWRGSPDHFALRLQAAGLSKWRTDGIAWIATALLVVIARLLDTQRTLPRVAILIAICALALVAARLLLRWEVRRSPPAPSLTPPVH